MPGTTQKPTTDPATLAWNELAERVDALIEGWHGDDVPPDLHSFLPAEPPALRRLVLKELVKIDMEYRWQHHDMPKQVEEYVEEFPELADNGEVSCDLIYEEYHVRRQLETPPEPDEYYKRFPEQVKRLRAMMTLEPNQMTTTTQIAGKRAADLVVGQQIDDFDLLVMLGKGSFGSVFLARQRSMQRIVALKISRDRGMEPQTLAQLDHPHIVRVYDQRVLTDRKLQLMYMQHIAGGTLQDVVQAMRQQAPALRTGKIILECIDRSLDNQGTSPPSDSGTRRKLAALPWAEAVCWIGSKLASALDYAHQRGVLHRDVKPANVLLAADAAPKLVDFNVSFSSKVEGATPAAYFGGSLAYMSPEQIEAYNPNEDRKPDELDGRSDVYSLAIVLWELLTGARPFEDPRMDDCVGDTCKLLQRLAAGRHAGVPDTAKALFSPDWPPGLPQILNVCLSAHVEDRPANAGQMARALELCLVPRAQRLLRPRRGSWWDRFRRWPFWFFVALGLVPSAVFAVLNLNFNVLQNKVLAPDSPELAFFQNVEVPVVNGTAFPIAVALVVGFAWPVLIAVGRVGGGRKVDSDQLALCRRRALWVGDSAAWIGLSLWVISGVVFPLWMNLHFGETKLGFLNFLASQIICGWISSTLTFYLLTAMFIRAFYPVLIQPERANQDEVEPIMRLETRCERCLILTVLAPIVALGLWVAFSGNSTQNDTQRYWMIALAFFGGGVSWVAFRLLKIIKEDLRALRMTVDPTGESSSVMTETSDSFWSGSRS
jgi:serine/threonine protein kinase